jgi:hypothetical protein
MNRQEISEAMEGCRSDLDMVQQTESRQLADALQQDPLLRARYDRIRSWDQVLGKALNSCSVPEGLCARLLDALEQSASMPLEMPDSASTSLDLPTQPILDIEASTQRPPVSSPAIPRRSWLRRSLWLAASLSAAALIFVSLWLNPFVSQTPQLTAEFADEIIHWTQMVSRSGWKTDFSDPELRHTPFDPRIQAIPHRWTWIETRYHARTVVYDLTLRRDEPAYLFCFVSRQSSLPSSPPGVPFSTTGGFSIGVWQQGDWVFVLAVRGSERRYRSLIQAPVILG